MGETRKFYTDKTRKGYPAMWETGGGATHTGDSQIIAAPDGGPKRPIYVRRRGHLAGGPHALFVVEEGDLVIRANHHRHDFQIEIWRVVGFDKEGEDMVAIAELTHSFEMGEWDPSEPTGTLAEAVAAAEDKATCYHCREVHWGLLEDE